MVANRPELNFKLHPRQLFAFLSKATEILYGGAAGSGKSHLTRVCLLAWCLLIPGLQCYLFRRHYEDVIKNHMEGPTGFRAMLSPLIEAGYCQVVETEVRFWNGSRIYLCHVSHDNHLQNYYGAEMHVLVIEEATQIYERFIRFLRSRVRMAEELRFKIPPSLAGCFPRVLYTSNPVGVSQGYFRKRFVKDIPPNEIVRVSDEEGGFLRQFIPAKLEDNPSIRPDEYRITLRGLGDKALVDALERGNWDAIVGDFLQEYDEEKHVIPDFNPPEHWYKYRTFDWGFAEPFAVYWIAVSDGEEFKDDQGRTRWLPAGALIAYREWYGCDEEDSAKGLRMRNEDIAQGILERTREMTTNHTVTDSLPFQSRGGKTIAEIFNDEGCPLTKGETSRIPGWSMLTDRLIGIDGYPMLYLCESCVHARDYLPALPRHPHNQADAAEHGPATHAADAIRLACTSRPMTQYAEKEESTVEIKPNKITFNYIQEHLLNRRNGAQY